MLNFERVADLLSGLTLIRFCPADDGARLELAKMVAKMATSEDQVEWLVQRAISLYAEWPGAREIRACFCSKFRPADGLSVGSTVYADGIPSERRIEAPAVPALPPGHAASADRQLDDGIRKLAAGAGCERRHEQGDTETFREMRRAHLREQHRSAMSQLKPITEEDLKKAQEEYYQKKLEGKPN